MLSKSMDNNKYLKQSAIFLLKESKIKSRANAVKTTDSAHILFLNQQHTVVVKRFARVFSEFLRKIRNGKL